VRCDAYAHAWELVTAPRAAGSKPAGLETLRANTTKYIGHLRNEFRNAMNTLMEAAGN